MQTIRDNTGDEIKKLLKKGFDSSGSELNILKDKAKRSDML